MSILQRLETARRDLLDLTTRSRLLHTPRSGRAKTVEVVDERADDVFRILLKDRKRMSFLPRPQERKGLPALQGDGPHLEQPLEVYVSEVPTANYVDTKLQTNLDSEGLQRRLLQMHYDEKSFAEEQGVSILYLALGFIKWFEAEASDKPRYAPLLLVPVTLQRESASSRFTISYNDEELSTNLSLQEKLKLDYGIELPDLPEVEDCSPPAYSSEVQGRISGQPRWEVLPDAIILGFFSFAKFLMYRDLDPKVWPPASRLEMHKTINGLLGSGFKEDPSPFHDDTHVDEVLDPREMVHVVGADSSQALAIEEVRRGSNLVIQGPPGTGKSQTIINLVATAVGDGKKVLFMAEKMAALDVVKNRLDEIGLGRLCLELHSHKAKKKTILGELEQTLDGDRAARVETTTTIDQLRQCRDRLNSHAARINAPIGAARYTPFEIAGKLVSLSAKGITPQEFELNGSVAWSRDEISLSSRQVDALAKIVSDIGEPAKHTWRGVRGTAFLPEDVHRLGAQAGSALSQVQKLTSPASNLARLIGCTIQNIADVEMVASFASMLASAPEADWECLAREIWSTRRPEIDHLVESGRRLNDVRGELTDVFTVEAWEAELPPIRAGLKAHGDSLLRVFHTDYRAVMRHFKSLTVNKLPGKCLDRLALLERMAAAQLLRKQFQIAGSIGLEAFGRFWAGNDSNWTHLEAICAWERLAAENKLGNAREIVATLAGTDLIKSRLGELTNTEDVVAIIWQLFTKLELDLLEAFGFSDITTISLADLTDRLAKWTHQGDGLHDWVKYSGWKKDADKRGLAGITERLHDGRLQPQRAVDVFNYVLMESLMRVAFAAHPELRQFAGSDHEITRAEFQRLDDRRIEQTRKEINFVHYQSLPKGMAGVGEVGLLRREMRKKRRHLPLRQLVSQAGSAIQTIKPVFMMSPMSIAQFLTPGAVKFDLLIIDEASQVQPVEALGAVARSGQIVVLGDEKQLPPTRFFQKMLGDEQVDEDDSEAFAAQDLESILGLCDAQGVGSRMLRWHYRSRHESLIAVSNREFYNSKLYIVPSSGIEENVGLRFNSVAGVYDRGGSATNRIEARAVAEAVMNHAEQCPDKTLGVGCFSVAQRDAILDELELLRRNSPQLESFFSAARHEPFFVKNLESIQGDERHVIFISVGYARDAFGYMAMNFGPVSGEGGERRLNVLISRARERCEVLSSITAADIDLNRGRGRGVAALKTFLQYAETGQLDVGIKTGLDPDSDFEIEVARALKQLGYEVHHQVGIAGFFIDLAIVDPERPGTYLLAIECDGATYHSSRSARDRDKLRQRVLEDRGWVVHRVWSTDWYRKPEAELRRVVEAAGAAERDRQVRASSPAPSAENLDARSPVIVPEVSKLDEASAETPAEVFPYIEADFRVDASCEPHEATNEFLAETVVKIAEIEEPIHKNEIARRLATVWGKDRCGSRIQAAARRGLDRAMFKGMVVREGDFFSTRKLVAVKPRNRANVASLGLKDGAMIPPVEIRTAVRELLKAHIAAHADEVTVHVARVFGFDRTGQTLKEVIANELKYMLDRGDLRFRGSSLTLG